jgi:hypothetical protein
MNAHTRQRILWWVLVVITVVSFTTALVLQRSFSSPEFVIISFAIYAIVGALVSWRRPENPIGWVFLWIGVLTGLAGLSGAGTEIALAEGPPIAWWGLLSAWFDSWFWNPLFVLATVVTFLLYPSGLASPRWLRRSMWETQTKTHPTSTRAPSLSTTRLLPGSSRDSVLRMSLGGGRFHFWWELRVVSPRWCRRSFAQCERVVSSESRCACLPSPLH